MRDDGKDQLLADGCQIPQLSHKTEGWARNNQNGQVQISAHGWKGPVKHIAGMCELGGKG